MEHLRVVAIGGGTGLSNLLRGLKHFPISLSAIVTMTDNGASSGRLRQQIGSLPPGDVRKCLAALSNDEDLLTKLFEYRFKKGRGLSGHSLGNLLLIALTELTGSFESAIQATTKILSIRGSVIPSTLEHVNLIAELKNGQMALGEANVSAMGHRFGIKRVLILPENAQANPLALHFISNADVILVGPGSLYTSIIPNFLIKDLNGVFSKSKAAKYFICNVSTERGETENFTVEKHFEMFKEYCPNARFETILVNNHLIACSPSAKAGKLGSINNITTSASKINGVKVVKADLIDENKPLFHDYHKLAKTIWHLIVKRVNPSSKKATARG